MSVDAGLPGASILRVLAPVQAPSHEVIRLPDEVVIAKGSLDRLTDLAEWLNATPQDAVSTFEVRKRSRKR